MTTRVLPRRSRPAPSITNTELIVPNGASGISKSGTSKQKVTELGTDANEIGEIREITIDDVTNGVQIKLNVSEQGDLWIVPVETLNMGENGIESTYQSTCFVLRWGISLKPGESWQGSIRQTLALNK